MYFSCTLLSFTITQTQVLSESSFLEICMRVVCYFPLTYRPCNNLVEESDRTSHTASRLSFTGINVQMKRWGTVIGVAFGLFFYPLSGDFFSRNQTAVFRNTEGDSLPNVINFQVPRVRIWPKKKLKNLNTTPSPSAPLFKHCYLHYWIVFWIKFLLLVCLLLWIMGNQLITIWDCFMVF